MFYDPPNRLAKFFPVEANPMANLPQGNKLLADAHVVKLELVRYADDDGSVDAVISFEVHGTVEAGDTLAALLAQFRKGGEGTVGHV
jgi:hypothetical protein